MLLGWTRCRLGCGRMATLLVLVLIVICVVCLIEGRVLLCEPCSMVTPPMPMSRMATGLGLGCGLGLGWLLYVMCAVLD